MPKIIAAQTNFAAGQITPRLHGQPEIKGYQQGVALMENFIPLAHGPCHFRNGFIVLNDIPGTFGVLRPMIVSAVKAYMLVISNDGNIWLNDFNGPVHQYNLLTNYDFSQGYTGWTDTSQSGGVAVITNGQLYLVPGSNPVLDRSASIDQTVTITTPTNLHHFHWASNIDQVGVRFRLMIGTTLGGAEVFDQDFTDHQGFTEFTPGAGNTTLYLRLYAYTNDPQRSFETLVLHDKTSEVHLSFPHPWDTDRKIAEVQIAQPPGGHELYFVQRDHAPRVLTLTDPDAWSFAPVSFTSQPAAWVSGNYPGTIAFFQGRMWLAGTNTEPEDIWGSKSAIYTDFTTGSLADDSIYLPMDKQGEIVWLVGSRNLLVGTSNSENILTSEGSILKPGDVQVEQQSAYGCSRVQPVAIGNRIIFLTADGMKLRDMSFEWTKDAYTSRDLLWIAEDLGKESRILRGTWVQTPEGLLFMLRQDGVALIGQYDDDLNLYGWSKHWFPGNAIIDASALTALGLPTLFVLSQVNADDTSMVLQYDPPEEDAVFADFAHILTGQGGGKVSQITGLTRLADKEVAVIVDGAVHPNRTLDSNGDDPEALQFDGDVVIVGLPYSGTVKTLSPVSGLNSGPDRTFVKHHARIFVDLLDSSVPILQGDRPPLRYPSTPMNTREPYTTGLKKVGNLGADRDAQITIVQDLPLKCVIRGIYLEKKTEST